MSEIKYVVFDVGGVLVELVGANKFIEWTKNQYKHEYEFYEAWIRSPAVRQFERGHCTKEFFVDTVIEEMQLPVSAVQFTEEFQSWPNGLLDGIADLLKQVKTKLPIACLSNTNELHWPNQKDADFLNTIFDQMFLSYQMGMVKPDQEIYAAMIEQIGLPASQILFLDDNKINVEGAAKAGLVARQVRGYQEVKMILGQFNI